MLGIIHKTNMAYYLSIEPVASERYRIVVRDADHRPLLHGSAFGQRECAPQAVDELREALGKDWLYRVQVQRRKRPSFLLRPAHGRAEYVSVDFSSCDQMERSIRALQACAATAPVSIQVERPLVVSATRGEIGRESIQDA